MPVVPGRQMRVKMAGQNNGIASCVNLVMGHIRLLLILVVLVFANLVRGPIAALASCAVTPQLATAISNAPAVFVGTVTSVDHAGRGATVHVQDIWKGRVAADVQMVGTPDLNSGATSVPHRPVVPVRTAVLLRERVGVVATGD